MVVAAPIPASGRDALVDALLAPLAPEVDQYQRRARGRTPAEVAGALAYLAERVLGPPPAGVRS
jgi:hypothetical protein